MSRWFLLFAPVLFACKSESGVIDVAGDSDNPDEEDFSEYDGATLRIVSPQSADFLALEESHAFEATLIDAAGLPIVFDAVSWTSNADTAWAPGTALVFEDETLDVGLHDITAEVALPNGDRLAHTVGGVRVQSMYAGTYAGMFSADITYDTYAFACSGAALLVVDAYGEEATGEATCKLSLMGFDIDAVFIFDLENDEGDLEGEVSADLGFTAVPFEAEGELDPETKTLTIAFGGDLFGSATIDANVDTNQVSLDTETP